MAAITRRYFTFSAFDKGSIPDVNLSWWQSPNHSFRLAQVLISEHHALLHAHPSGCRRKKNAFRLRCEASQGTSSWRPNKYGFCWDPFCMKQGPPAEHLAYDSPMLNVDNYNSDPRVQIASCTRTDLNVIGSRGPLFMPCACCPWLIDRVEIS